MLFTDTACCVPSRNVVGTHFLSPVKLGKAKWIALANEMSEEMHMSLPGKMLHNSQCPTGPFLCLVIVSRL